MSDSSDIYLLEELLTDEERAVRDRVRAYCDTEIRPVINGYWERAEFPRTLAQGLVPLGIVGGTIDEHGGPGLSPRAAGLVAMELARCDGSISTFHGVHTGIAMRTIAMLGSPEQRARWLPAMALLDLIGAFGLTEPDHGSDAVALETRARREGDAYVLDGDKRWIGNGTFADVLVVWARDDDGDVGAFVVERGTEGIRAEPITGKIGKRASLQAEIEIRGARVPAANRLPGARTFGDAAAVLAAARPAVAWGALGHAQACYEIAFGYLSQRSSFGRPLAGHQLVQARLATMLAHLTTMKLVCFRLADLAAAGLLTPAQSSLAKMNNARSARIVTSEARDLLGGNGILLDHHVARHFLDVEVVATVEGTDAVQSLVVGREITGISAFG